MCKAGVDVVFSLSLQYNPPDVRYMFKNKQRGDSQSLQILSSHFVSRGRKSLLLFTSGKRKAEVLMTSVGLGVTRLRTCWYMQMGINSHVVNVC